jgi:hypothetical protein
MTDDADLKAALRLTVTITVTIREQELTRRS